VTLRGDLILIFLDLPHTADSSVIKKIAKVLAIDFSFGLPSKIY
jgi:hypothetical protein